MIKPYPEQIAAAKAAARAGRGIIVASTGTGKSLMITLLINELQVPTLVVVPSLELKRQLTTTFQTFFGVDKVGSLKTKPPLAVENVDALDTKKPLDPYYHCVIIDEFHRSGAKTYQDLNHRTWQNVFHKYGFTATPFRSAEEECILLESILAEVVYRLEYQTAVERGYICPLQVFYYDLLVINVRESLKWDKVYKELVTEREDRNKIIADITSNLTDNKISTLVLTKQIEHGLKLQEMLAERGHAVPFAKGENDNNRETILEFNLRESTTLIGTVGVLGEGIDTKPAEFVILAGGGKSKNAFMQNLGRSFRKYPGKEAANVILFKDDSHKWLQEHWRAQCAYLLEEFGVIPEKLELPEAI